MTKVLLILFILSKLIKVLKIFKRHEKKSFFELPDAQNFQLRHKEFKSRSGNCAPMQRIVHFQLIN